MHKQIAEKWCDALESGDYKQTIDCLCDSNGFCCLGVLTDLYIKAENVGEWVESGNGRRTFVSQPGNQEPHYLPTEVARWAGMFNGDPYVMVGEDNVQLSTLNDTGSDFTYLARHIRAQYKDL